MPRHVAFLRGMNIGGRRITNDELRAHFTAIGLTDVQTFRASGNVIFTADQEDEGELQARVEAGLAAALAYEVPTFIRSAPELHAIAASCPFPTGTLAASAGKLQVALLADAPSTDARGEALALNEGEDNLGFAGRELYWLPNGPMSASTLDLKRIERLLGKMTIRTMGTIEQLAARL